MLYNQPVPPSAPIEDPDIPVASAIVSEEDYGYTSNSVSNAGVPNNPNGRSSTSDKIIGAAAIAGGVAGLVLAGPLIAVVGAVGAGALATQSTKAGDVARASGDVVISAGERAKKIDEKHHVVDKTKKASKDLYTKAKTFEGKHHLGAKAGKSLTNGLKFVSSKLKPKDKSNTW